MGNQPERDSEHDGSGRSPPRLRIVHTTRMCRRSYERLFIETVQRIAIRGSGVLAVGGLLVGAESAFAANNCMQDITTAHNGGTLNCNSNDVRIAHVTNISAVSGITGSGTVADPFKCFAGGGIEFTADFEVDLRAQARYDIGLYIAQNQLQALSGTCNLKRYYRQQMPRRRSRTLTRPGATRAVISPVTSARRSTLR